LRTQLLLVSDVLPTFHRLSILFRYASKELLDILHHLSFAESYDEIQRLNAAFLEAGESQHDFDTFMQTVWDNADKNVRTATGFGTFHALGGIAVVTPKGNHTELLVKRNPKAPQAFSSGKFGLITLKKYNKPSERPLSKIKVAPL
jgi:hypothetical protein